MSCADTHGAEHSSGCANVPYRFGLPLPSWPSWPSWPLDPAHAAVGSGDPLGSAHANDGSGAASSSSTDPHSQWIDADPLPTNIAAVIALLEQIGEVLTSEPSATPEEIQTLMRLWSNANIMMNIDEYLAMFGRPTAESEWGTRLRESMVRLVARYARNGPKSSWYLNQATDLKWGWWQIPEHLSYNDAVTPPGPRDFRFVPCVYFLVLEGGG